MREDQSVKQQELIIQLRSDVCDLLMWLDIPRVEKEVWWKELKVSVAGGASVTVPYQHAAQTITVK